MEEFYWEIVKRDGTMLEVSPAAVPTVRARWDEGQPIHTKFETIPAHQIVDFRQTSRRFGQPPLLEAAAQAFGQPIVTDNGTVKARWVKKTVTHREYSTKCNGPGYHRLEDQNGMAVVAFRVAIHDIDYAKVSDCSSTEIAGLEK